MGEFKPMTKMQTTEPSVILKLKKGGSAKSKDKDDCSHKPMNASAFAPAESGKAPGKPSMMERRKAMMPAFAKGGVAKKAMGGSMPVPGLPGGGLGGAAPMGGSVDPQQLAQAMMAKKAMGLKSGGGVTAPMTKTTLKPSVAPFAKTKVTTDQHPSKSGKTTGDVKNGKPGGYAMGGTISGNEGPFEHTKMVTGTNKTTGTKGSGVRMGNDGGYAKGGNVTGLSSATVKGGDWENKPADTSKPGKTNATTGEVRKGNAGGYQKGGVAKKSTPRAA